MKIGNCPQCSSRVLPSPAGECPSCRANSFPTEPLENLQPATSSNLPPTATGFKLAVTSPAEATSNLEGPAVAIGSPSHQDTGVEEMRLVELRDEAVDSNVPGPDAQTNLDGNGGSVSPLPQRAKSKHAERRASEKPTSGGLAVVFGLVGMFIANLIFWPGADYASGARPPFLATVMGYAIGHALGSAIGQKKNS